MYTFKNFNIKKVIVGDLNTNCYIIEKNDLSSATIIDPGADVDKIVSNISAKKVDSVILTHGHFDHIMAIDELAKKYNFKLYIHEKDVEMLSDANKNLSELFMPVSFTISHNYIVYKEGDVLSSSDLSFEVMHTPGHTKGSSCLLTVIDNKNILFTGDTLFSGGYGRTDLYGGDFSALVNSMRRLFKLKGTYQCFPGHGEDTTLGKEE